MLKVRFLNRFKVFKWRVLRGVFPTRIRLQDRGVPCTDGYPQCEARYKIDWHQACGIKLQVICHVNVVVQLVREALSQWKSIRAKDNQGVQHVHHDTVNESSTCDHFLMLFYSYV
ncbi:hypothetical protein MtrunA17_Chr5g0400381 [Medicago truncatula]|uniref:Uncharacterized protein n=1 Tax=Medicago truncatula TaxID=3880 RepID=G7JZW3_MEDTR|nr:hypothetical protein MTR_5g014210 [Medicago truncatula]RHN53853.1 hypothetical protein MtrunA17_Chr5g0400381 [Medicago truncatula]